MEERLRVLAARIVRRIRRLVAPVTPEEVDRAADSLHDSARQHPDATAAAREAIRRTEEKDQPDQ